MQVQVSVQRLVLLPELVHLLEVALGLHTLPLLLPLLQPLALALLLPVAPVPPKRPGQEPELPLAVQVARLPPVQVAVAPVQAVPLTLAVPPGVPGPVSQ